MAIPGFIHIFMNYKEITLRSYFVKTKRVNSGFASKGIKFETNYQLRQKKPIHSLDKDKGNSLPVTSKAKRGVRKHSVCMGPI